MKDSPKEFKEHTGNQYIHRITKAVSDTGMEFKMLRQVAFVQLDKALELLLSNSYNEDEDIELLMLCAMMADINNEKVLDLYKSDPFLSQIREDAFRFSLDKEVQPMLIQEEMAVWDDIIEKTLVRDKYVKIGEEKGLAKGEAERKALEEKNRMLREKLEALIAPQV